MTDIYLRNEGGNLNMYLLKNGSTSTPRKFFLEALQEKFNTNTDLKKLKKMEIFKNSSNYQLNIHMDERTSIFSQFTSKFDSKALTPVDDLIYGFKDLSNDIHRINSVITVDDVASIPARVVAGPVHPPLVCDFQQVVDEDLMRPLYNFIKCRYQQRLNQIMSSYVIEENGKYRINLPDGPQYYINNTIINNQNIDSQTIVQFEPTQRNRNILKVITSNHRNLLLPVTPLIPSDEFKKKRIETVINFIKCNFYKPIPYDLVRNHLYKNYLASDLVTLNQIPHPNGAWGAIDVPNYNQVLSNCKVKIYIFDREFGQTLELRNIVGVDGMYIPTKRLLCGVEDLFNIEDGNRIKVSPPGGSCDFIQGADHNEILTLNAQKELNEESDVHIEFINIINPEGGPIRVQVPEKTFELNRRFTGQCRIKLKNIDSNEVNDTLEPIELNYLCVKTNNLELPQRVIINNEWNFFIPLTTANYERLRDNLEQRAKIFETLTDAELYMQEGVPDYEDKSNIMMKKYLKYKSKYLELKKKLGK